MGRSRRFPGSRHARRQPRHRHLDKPVAFEQRQGPPRSRGLRRSAHRRIGTRNVDIDPDDHPEQFDVATMRAKIRAHRVQRLCHPLLDVAPVQVMHEEQRRGEVVCGEAVQDVGGQSGGLVDDFEYPSRQ